MRWWGGWGGVWWWWEGKAMKVKVGKGKEWDEAWRVVATHLCPSRLRYGAGYCGSGLKCEILDRKARFRMLTSWNSSLTHYDVFRI